MNHPVMEKILAALAGSASTNYVDESILFAIGRKLAINLALEDLLGKRTIVTCQITKGGRTFNVYWMAQQLFKPKLYSALFTPERMQERAAAKKAKPIAKNATERNCKRCLVTKPINAYKGIETKCAQCMKELRAEKYKLLAAQSIATPTRRCMACKKSHPVSDFGNARSRRCVASMLLYKQNARAILTQKNREWRAKIKAAQTKTPPTEELKPNSMAQA